MIISRTPFRISFFGGGTDYPSWYRIHGGSVLATTINKYCYLTCRYLPPFFEHRIRVVYSKTEYCQDAEEIKHPAVREILRYLKIDRGVEIHHDGDLPARSGIGSSSAFTVGLLHALYALKGHIPTKHKLAQESITVEQELLKEMVGSQDQVLAAYGGFNHVTFFPNGEFSVKPMTLPPGRIQDLNSHLMLFFTGIHRTASHLAKSYVQDVESKKRQIQMIGDMVNEAVSILSGDRDLLSFGKLLHEGWQAKCGLSPKVSNPAVNEMYTEALCAGAIGGKLIGAGGGGFLLLFVAPSRQSKVRQRLRKLIHVPFKFESLGSQIIFFDPEEDYTVEEEARSKQQILAFKELSQDGIPMRREVWKSRLKSM